MQKMTALREFQSMTYGNVEQGRTFEAREQDVDGFTSLGLAEVVAKPAKVEPAKVEDKPKGKRL